MFGFPFITSLVFAMIGVTVLSIVVNGGISPKSGKGEGKPSMAGSSTC